MILNTNQFIKYFWNHEVIKYVFERETNQPFHEIMYSKQGTYKIKTLARNTKESSFIFEVTKIKK